MKAQHQLSLHKLDNSPTPATSKKPRATPSRHLTFTVANCHSSQLPSFHTKVPRHFQLRSHNLLRPAYSSPQASKQPHLNNNHGSVTAKAPFQTRTSRRLVTKKRHRSLATSRRPRTPTEEQRGLELYAAATKAPAVTAELAEGSSLAIEVAARSLQSPRSQHESSEVAHAWRSVDNTASKYYIVQGGSSRGL